MTGAAQARGNWLSRPWLAGLAALCLIFGLWSALAAALGFTTLPGPMAALKALPGILLDPGALWAIGESLARMFIGYAWALLCAIPLGLAMARSPALRDICSPLVALSYPMPKAALMPIIMLWFGLGSFSKILVIAMGVSLPVLYHSYQGALQVEKKLVWTAQSMGMGPVSRLLRIILPAAMPEILIGCRVGVVMALIVMVSSEMIARQEGVGNLLFTAMDMAQYAAVYATILVLAVIGFVLDWLFGRIRRVLTRWADEGS